MTPVLFIVAAVVGGLIRWGAVRWWHCSWQAVLAANIAGSALLGWLLATDAGPATITVVGVAFAGSLTTFSTFALEVRESRPSFAAMYVFLTIVGCVGAASVGATI